MILKDNYVRLNSSGKRRHSTYPSEATYKVIDFYEVPGARLTKLTCSCEQIPNPKSKKGLYYMTDSEVTEVGQEKKLENLATFDFINYPNSYCSGDIDKIFLKTNRCLNILNTYEIPRGLKEELSKLNDYFRSNLEEQLKNTTDIFNDNIKLSLLYHLSLRLEAEVKLWKKQARWKEFRDYHFIEGILRAISCTQKCTYDHLSKSFRDKKSFDKAFDTLQSMDAIDKVVDNGEEYFTINAEFRSYINE